MSITCLKHQVLTGGLFAGKSYIAFIQRCELTTITYKLAEGCLMEQLKCR